MDDFSTRLIQLLEFLHIKPVELAEKMGVQRTSFNHLLSGRNKPGFEFLHRLHSCYPEVNLNWLITGTGSITTNDGINFSPPESLSPPTLIEPDLFSNIFNSSKSEPSVEEVPPAPRETRENKPSLSEETEIDRLILVYKSGKMVEIKH